MGNIVLYQINLFCENCDLCLGERNNPRQSGTSDGTRDVIINHFIISTNIQTNE